MSHTTADATCNSGGFLVGDVVEVEWLGDRRRGVIAETCRWRYMRAPRRCFLWVGLTYKGRDLRLAFEPHEITAVPGASSAPPETSTP